MQKTNIFSLLILMIGTLSCSHTYATFSQEENKIFLQEEGNGKDAKEINLHDERLEGEQKNKEGLEKFESRNLYDSPFDPK